MMDMDEDLPEIKISIEEDDILAEECEATSNENSATLEEREDVKVVEEKHPSPLERSRIYKNKAGAFVTGLDLSSEVTTKKLAERAERFGVQKQAVSQRDIECLFKSLNIQIDVNNKPISENIRLDAIHMRGVQEMNTDNVFGYFKNYGPGSVEWIDDVSCNVIWLDNEGAIRALLGLSEPMEAKKELVDETVLKENVAEDKEMVVFMSDIELETDEDEADENADDESTKHAKRGSPVVPDASRSGDVPMAEYTCELPVAEEKEEGQLDDDDDVDISPIDLPSGFWRKGAKHPKAQNLLLRFATKDDKKMPGAEKRSEYYRKYGNPNYGGMTGYISQSKKRRFTEKTPHLSDPLSDYEDIDNDGYGSYSLDYAPERKKKKIRMRMEADDEEDRIKLLKESAMKKRSVHERLSYQSHTGSSYQSHRNRDKVRYSKHYEKESIYDRLGSRRMLPTARAKYRSDTESSEDEDREVEIRSAVTKASGHSKYSIWNSLAKTMDSSSWPNTRSSGSVKSDLRLKLENLRHREKSPDYRSPLLRGDYT